MRKYAGLLAALVAAATVFGIAHPASAVTPSGTRASHAAATWLNGQLKDGLLQYGGGYGNNDGSSIDAALQLAATGHDAIAEKITNAIEAGNASAYTDSAYCGTSPYTCQAGDPGWVTSRGAGEVAKALVLAEVMENADVPALAGELEQLVQSTGEIADDVTVGGAAQPADNDDNYANTLGQAFAVWGLDMYDPSSAQATSATSYLLDLQCNTGPFRADFAVTPGSCLPGAPGKAGSGSVDTTATVLLALENLQPTPAVTVAKRHAISWLLKVQKKSGAFNQDGTGRAVNANSTGLAGWVLGIAGKKRAAARAAGWLVDHQVPATATGNLAPVRGAVEYNAATVTATKKNGWAASQDQWIVATAQCVAALTYAPKGS